MTSNHLRATTWRLFATVWLVYGLHATTNVARETYLALSLGERFSIRVDEYIGLHDDLFEIPGRGAYINNNQGASFLGAVPVLATRPLLGALFTLAPGLVAPKAAATYDDPRPNRNIFLNRARERGLDIKLGLIALITQFLLMAPLGAAAACLVFVALYHRLHATRVALGLALIYAFVTPIFFRSAFLNQNALIAHFVLGAWACLAGLRPLAPSEALSPMRLFGVGLLLGLAVLTDYSGIPVLLVFLAWIATRAWHRDRLRGVMRDAWWTGLGGFPSLLALLGYQWAAFGHPLWPAQRYMPPTPYSVLGWNGFTWPTVDLLVGNLLDPRYGLLAFCPLLIVGLLGWKRHGRETSFPVSDARWMLLAALALYLFSSANQFATLQWNTGVRYLVPAVPLLFLAAVPRLLDGAAWWKVPLLVASGVISWVVSMTREDVVRSLVQVFTSGFELPILTILQKTASGYLPSLSSGVDALPLLALTGLMVWLIWRGGSVPEGA